MQVGELLYQIDKLGITLRCGWSEDRLHYAPCGALPPELVAKLKEHKQQVIRILREDENYRRTGIIQCERQVFDLARDYFREDGRV
jgi:TubC N-terminal docking domain